MLQKVQPYIFLLFSLTLALSLNANPVLDIFEGKPLNHDYNDSRVEFAGSWIPVVTARGQAQYMMRSDKAGDSVELDFIGTSVGLIHKDCGLGWESVWGVIQRDMGRPLGFAEVLVDGKPAAAVPGFVEVDDQGHSFIKTMRGGNTLLATGLPPGRHRVKITNLGRSCNPEGSTTIVIKGFWCDSDCGDNVTSRIAWRLADSVRGGEGWRSQALKLAADVKGPDDLPPLRALYDASLKIDVATAPLRGLTAEPPASPMTAYERKYWSPRKETVAYQKRIASLKKSVDAELAEFDSFQFDSARPENFKNLLDQISTCVEKVNEFFKEEAEHLPPIVFFTGSPLRSGAAANHIWQGQPHEGRWGCSIRTYDPKHPDQPARVIFEDPNSIIYDLNLSYDVKTVFFSMRRNREQCWHIYEIGVDGSNFKQITHGSQYDACPVPLPDGRIAFISSRTPGYHTVCQSGPSTHVYVMNRDGSDARDLSSNTLSDFGLNMLQDGRLIFSRWEYIDVNLTFRQSLWTQYPDGRQFELWFGNTILDPATFWQVREIPGRYTLVGTFTSHHHTPHGAIGLITNRNGPEAPRGSGFRWITKEFPAVLDNNLFWSYRDPYPVYENRYLVSYGGGGKNRFRIYLLDDMDNKVQVYEDPATSCMYPLPLVPRPVPAFVPEVKPVRIDKIHVPAAPPGQLQSEDVPLGTLMVTDVYHGRTSGIERGRIKSIRIMEQMPKTVDRTWNFVLDQGPLMGASSYYAKRVWGYAPVERDGSANFQIPAQKEIYLQVCDAQGRELQRMTSALQVMPGETLSCAGCHESRQSVLPSKLSKPVAMQRAPTPLSLPEWGNAGVMDYNRIVQPVLDRNCVSCHKGANPPKGVLLTGDYTRFFNMSYDNLVIRTHSDEVSRALYTGHSKEKPMVQSLHLLHGIIDPFEPQESGSLVSRLPDFFKPEHCKKEVPLSDRRIIHEWIDAMIPYYATSDYARLEAKSNRDKWADLNSRQLLSWFTDGFAPVYNRRCASCHGKAEGELGLKDKRQWSWINLTSPELSPALTAHLSKDAGGRGIPAKDFQFKDATDPDYQTMLKAIAKGGKKAYETPEADMPGFRSRSKYRAFHYNYITRVGPETLGSRSRKSASHSYPGGSVDAMTDGLVTELSSDKISFFAWWDHKSSVEWVQMDFPEAAEVSKTRVFWFSDRSKNGGCDVPLSWRLLYRDSDAWKPVEQPSAYETKLNCLNETTFKPVRTSALRLEVQLKEGWSGGVSEWIVE